MGGGGGVCWDEVNLWWKDGCQDRSVFWVKMGRSVERSAEL